MTGLFSVHSDSSGESDHDVNTPRSERTMSSPAISPAKSTTSSVDEVADMIARRRAMEEQEINDEAEEEEDAADIYAQMRQRILGDQGKTSTPVSAATTKPDGKRMTLPNPAPRTNDRPTHHPSPVKQLRQSAPILSALSTSDTDSDVPVVSKKRARPTQLFADTSDSGSGSDSDPLPEPSRLQELIAQRRRERLEKEELVARERSLEPIPSANTKKDTEATRISDDDVEGPIADRTVEDRLTQQSRPTRKASKKAIEEMNRETQRLNRNMQLTHQAKVKTRFSIADFAARFASKSAAAEQEMSAQAASSSAPPSSDIDIGVDEDTPPSSPPSDAASPNLGKSILGSAAVTAEEQDHTELPSLEEILAQSLRKTDKGKAPAIQPEHVQAIEQTEKANIGLNLKKLSPRNYRVTPVMTAQIARDSDSSDDGLEIVKDRFSVFNEVQPRKSAESRAFQNLRFLANMNNHEVAGRGKHAKPSMTAAQLDIQLRRRAALQARHERDEKIAALRARGVIVQTAEERERDQMEVENLLEKARAEAEDLRKKEKALAKAAGKELDMEASDDESDDEEWQEDAEADGDDEAEAQGSDDEDLDVSGSEEEEMDDEEDGHDQEKINGLVDDAADETDAEIEGPDKPQADLSTITPRRTTGIPGPSRRISRKKFVVEDDDEDDDDTPVGPSTRATQQSEDPGSVDDIAAAFGFEAAPMALMSPSQMFAGTMGASQSQRDSSLQTQEQDSMDLFNEMVPSGASSRPETPTVAFEPTQTQRFDVSTPSSVRRDSSQILHTPVISGLSQYSNVPTPSQDMGFSYFHQEPRREHSLDTQSATGTIDTVMLSVPESPVQQKRGRLQRRRVFDEESVADLDDAEEEIGKKTTEKQTTAFDMMRNATAKPQQPNFDKKKSGAKNMIDEQAEESEDEYAGLGGASDDESGGEADEIDKQMIDESDIKVDERKMAAFYAEKARAENEAQTSKLYKDLMSGALRRQRGDAFDLDSDEDEQLAERRRRKQREEARKRRLLLGDEQLGKFDGNEKKEAFLRAIEDRDEADEDVDMLDGKDRDADDTPVTDSQPDASQPQSQPETLQQVTGNALKRKSDDSQTYDGPFKRPALTTTIRRAAPNAAFLKPASIAEVRASVSFLVDEPHNDPRPSLDAAEEDPEPELERAHFSARRTPAAPVVDRLLMRQTSSSVSTASAQLAFVSRSASALSLSRAPTSLLRRATSAASASSSSSSAGAAGLRSEVAAAGRRGKGKSSIAYAAREVERRAVLEGVERRRREDVKRIAGMRRGAGLGGLGSGGFE